MGCFQSMWTPGWSTLQGKPVRLLCGGREWGEFFGIIFFLGDADLICDAQEICLLVRLVSGDSLTMMDLESPGSLFRTNSFRIKQNYGCGARSSLSWKIRYQPWDKDPPNKNLFNNPLWFCQLCVTSQLSSILWIMNSVNLLNKCTESSLFYLF